MICIEISAVGDVLFDISSEMHSILSYEVAVFQWITSCNKTVMTTLVLTLFAGIRNVIDDVHNNNVNFHLKYAHFKGDKTVFKKSYYKSNLTLVVISYEISTE